MKQNYQRVDAEATALAVPEAVTVAIGEVVADVREGLLAMAAMRDADVAAACGPRASTTRTGRWCGRH